MPLSKKGIGAGFKVYYASDIHGSELLWRKFINAARFYGAEVLVRGGDLAGTGIRLYMMLGNDDEPSLLAILSESRIAVD